MAETIVIDHGLSRLLRSVRELNGKGVKVGIQAGSGNQDGVDLVDIAVFNEMGTATIPARPFMRQAAARNEAETHRVMEHLAGKVHEGAPVDTAIRTLGAYYQGKVQDEIRSGDFVPNAPATIRKKGSSVPLIDKGKLVQAVRYEVLK